MRALFLLSIAFVLPAAGQKTAVSFDVRQTVDRLAQACARAETYALEGDLVLLGRRGADAPRLLAKSRIHLAVAEPSRYLLKIAAEDKDEYWIVSNGEKTWWYVPRLKRYMVEEGAVAAGDGEDEDDAAAERDPSEKFARLIVPMLAELNRDIQAADSKGAGEIKIGKQKELWPVVRVLAKQHGNAQELTEVTMDPASLRVGRIRNIHGSREGGEQTTIQLDVDLRSFQIGQPIPDSLFDFVPPKNAKQADAVPIPGQTGSFLINQPAPDLELKTLEGFKVRLSELRGKPVLLSFWASWCGPCRRELPLVVKLNGELKSKGLVVLGVNDEGRGTARKFAAENGLNFDTLDDSGYKAHKLFRIRSIPSTFLIDRDGRIVRFLSGARAEPELRVALKSIGF